MATKKHDLSELPPRYRKKSRQWYVDTTTGKRIHRSNIHNFLPGADRDEVIRGKRWDLKYD